MKYFSLSHKQNSVECRVLSLCTHPHGKFTSACEILETAEITNLRGGGQIKCGFGCQAILVNLATKSMDRGFSAAEIGGHFARKCAGRH